MRSKPENLARDNPAWVFKQAPSGKLFELESPAEFHRRTVWGHLRCQLCDGPVACQIRIWLPSDVIAEMDPVGFARGLYPIDRTLDVAKNGVPYHHLPHLHACALCKKSAVQIAARQHSTARVIVDEGVSENANRPIVQVI